MAAFMRSGRAREGSEVVLLGHEGPLDWTQDSDGLGIQLPPGLKEAGTLAWVFRIESAR